MTRPVKFRGQVTDTKKWVFGFYFNHAGIDRIFVPDKGSFTVIQETVGQFTGLFDKNAVEVYEGDICQIMMRRRYGHEKDGLSRPLGPVEFSRISVREESLYVFDTFNIKGQSLHYLASMELEVIGNIHEGKETTS